MKKIFLLAILLFSFFYSLALRSDEEGLSVIKTKEGFLFIFNDKNESFKIEFQGKKFWEVEPEELVFMMDGVLIQFTLVPLEIFLKPEVNLDTLSQHFEFEARHIASTYNFDREKIEIEKFRLLNGRYAFVWKVKPENSVSESSPEKVILHLFATTNTNKHIFMVTTPLTKKSKAETIKQKIIKAFNTLECQFSFFNIQNLQDSIRKKNKSIKNQK
ncbi:MAG: hypothetical protein N2517_07885 [Ignavibacteria bacterium]|nr:hypothetical protein [Ignavibacteria bacterium]